VLTGPVNSAATAEDLSRHFEQKVAAVLAATAGATAPVFTPPDHPGTQYPLPVNLLMQVIDEIAPYLTELFNRSLALGHFPDMYKDAYITPLLKKPSLDAADVKSY